jgi:hypothetical protein
VHSGALDFAAGRIECGEVAEADFRDKFDKTESSELWEKYGGEKGPGCAA